MNRKYFVGDVLQRIITDNYDLKDPQLYKIDTIYYDKNSYLLRNMQTNQLHHPEYIYQELDVFFRKVSSTVYPY